MIAPLFVSHGAPSVLTGASAAREFLAGHGAGLATPRAYLVVSAHWESDPIRVTASPRPDTVQDFRGFGDYLARFQYPARGDAGLAKRVAAHLSAAGLESVMDPARGLDHGVWTPMALLKPEPDAPVLQISLPARASADDASLALGRALAPLAGDHYQLIFSGAPTHSLRDAIGAAEDAPRAAFAVRFNAWLAERLARNSSLDAWRSAPDAARNHPTPEHLRPLIAAAQTGRAERLHHSWTHGALAMDVWRFQPDADA